MNDHYTMFGRQWTTAPLAGRKEIEMRTHVVVDGIKLTRAQVELAMKQLSEPENLKCLTIVRNKHDGRPGVVITGQVQKHYTRSYSVTGDITVVDAHGDGSTYDNERTLLLGWEVVDGK